MTYCEISLSLVAIFQKIVLKDKMYFEMKRKSFFEDNNYMKYQTKQFWFLSLHNSGRDTLDYVPNLTKFIRQTNVGRAVLL